MDAFGLASAHEGFGLVVAEALLCGVPVVATNVGCVPEVLQRSRERTDRRRLRRRVRRRGHAAARSSRRGPAGWRPKGKRSPSSGCWRRAWPASTRTCWPGCGRPALARGRGDEPPADESAVRFAPDRLALSGSVVRQLSRVLRRRTQPAAAPLPLPGRNRGDMEQRCAAGQTVRPAGTQPGPARRPHARAGTRHDGLEQPAEIRADGRGPGAGRNAVRDRRGLVRRRVLRRSGAGGRTFLPALHLRSVVQRDRVALLAGLAGVRRVRVGVADGGRGPAAALAELGAVHRPDGVPAGLLSAARGRTAGGRLRVVGPGRHQTDLARSFIPACSSTTCR